MEHEFWLEKWKKNDIGFHKMEFHPSLVQQGARLELNKSQTVLLPLCGKTLDLIWWSQYVGEVHGVELSDIACESFFNEHNLNYQKSHESPFDVYQGENIQLFQGDFFQFSPDKTYDYIYDRAAMIALPPALRRAYQKKLKEWIHCGSRLLLITIEYDQALAEGPPFSVQKNEVEEAFSGLQVQVLSTQQMKLDNPKFKHLTQLSIERTYLIQR